jgi:large subunit ribosomal protein L25
MTEMLSVDCEVKEKHGKGIARSLRRDSRVPINIYGKGLKNITASITEKAALAICHRFVAKTSLVELKIGSDKYKVLPKEVALHPVTDEIIHIDFLCTTNAQMVKIEVPIKISGADLSVGIKRGGVVNMTTRFIKSEVTTSNIPSFIEVDISQLTIGDTLRLQDLKLPQNLRPLEKDLKKTIIKLVGKKAKADEAAASEAKDSAPAKAEGTTK